MITPRSPGTDGEHGVRPGAEEAAGTAWAVSHVTANAGCSTGLRVYVCPQHGWHGHRPITVCSVGRSRCSRHHRITES